MQKQRFSSQKKVLICGIVFTEENGVDKGCLYIIRVFTGILALSLLLGISVGTVVAQEEITNTQELQDIQDDLDADYVLTNDIDASGVSFDPIGECNFFNGSRGCTGQGFSGTLDGNGNTIYNLDINKQAESEVGLFDYIESSGVVKDLGIVGAEVSGETGVGVLAGFNEGKISRSYTTGSVDVGQFTAGGFAGVNVGKITKSYSHAGVNGADPIGGFVGEHFTMGDTQVSTDDISGTYRTTSVETNLTIQQTATITESYATGEVAGSEQRAGGFVGVGSDGEVASSYWDIESTGQATSDVGEGFSTDEMTGSEAKNNMNGFDFTTTWDTVSNPDDYPVLTWQQKEIQEDIEILSAERDIEGQIFQGLGIEDTYWVELSSETGSVKLELNGQTYDGIEFEEFLQGQEGFIIAKEIATRVDELSDSWDVESTSRDIAIDLYENRFGEVGNTSRVWVVEGVELGDLEEGSHTAKITAQASGNSDTKEMDYVIESQPGWFGTLLSIGGDPELTGSAGVKYNLLDSDYGPINELPDAAPWEEDFLADSELSVSILVQPNGDLDFGGGGMAEFQITGAGLSINGELDGTLTQDNELEEVEITLELEVTRKLAGAELEPIEDSDAAKLTAVLEGNIGVNGNVLILNSFDVFREAGAGIEGGITGNAEAKAGGAGGSVEADGSVSGSLDFVRDGDNWIDDGTLGATVKLAGEVDLYIWKASAEATLVNESVSVIGGDFTSFETVEADRIDKKDWSVMSKTGNNPSDINLAASDAVTQTRITDRQLTDTEPTVTRVNNGEVVVWSQQLEKRPIEDGQDIAVRMPSGEKKMLTDESRHNFAPSVAGEDDLLVAWSHLDTDMSDATNPEDIRNHETVAFTRYDSDQDSWETPQLLSDTDDMEGNPSVAYHGGNWLVAWERDTGDPMMLDNRNVRYAVLNESGIIANGTVSGAQKPEVGVTPEGNFEMGYFDRQNDKDGEVVRSTLTETSEFNLVEQKRYVTDGLVDLSVDGGQIVWVDNSLDEPRIQHDNGEELRNMSLLANMSSVREVNLEVDSDRTGDDYDALLTYRGSPETQESSDLMYRLARDGEWIVDRRVAGGDDTNLTLFESGSVLDKNNFSLIYTAKKLGTKNKGDIFVSTHEFRPDYAINANRPRDVAFAPGDEVPVEYKVRNVGDVDGQEQIPIVIESNDTRMGTQMVGPLRVNETSTGIFNVPMDETGTFELSVDPDDEVTTIGDSDEWLRDDDNVTASLPNLRVSEVDADRKGEKTLSVNITVSNLGGVEQNNLTVQLQDGEGPIKNSTVNVSEYDENEVRMNVSTEGVNRTLSDQIVLDPLEKLPDRYISRRTHTTSLFYPDISLYGPVDYNSETDMVSALIKNEGTAKANSTVQVKSSDSGNVFGTTQLNISAPVNQASVYEVFAVQLEEDIADKGEIVVEGRAAGHDPDVSNTRLTFEISLFTQPLINRDGFVGAPQNILPSQGGFSDSLVEDLDGDGEATDVGPSVTVFGYLIRGNDLGLTDAQARKLNWNSGSPETEVTVADMVTLFGEKIRAG